MSDLIINGADFDKVLEEARWKLHRTIELKCYVDLTIYPSVTELDIFRLIEHTYSRMDEILGLPSK